MFSLRFSAVRFALLLLAGPAILLLSGCASTSPAGSEAVLLAPPSDGDLDSAKEKYARRHFIRGLTRARLGDPDAAITHYEQALEAAPEAPALLSALAEAQAARGDLPTALYYAELARTAGAETAYYHRQLARLYRRAEQPEKALRAYRQLWDRFPDDTDARLALARLQAETGRAGAALATYQMLSTHGAPSPALRAEMLALYRKTGDTQAAERALKALIRQEPQDNAHRRALARFYRQQGRMQAALPLLEEVHRRTPGDAKTAALLAEVYRATGHPEDAAALERRAPADAAGATAAHFVERARPLYRRATGSAASADAETTRAATRFLEQALEKNPAHAEALAMLGALRFQAGAFAEAAALLTRSLDENPRAPERWSRAANAYLNAGQPERAAAVADEGLLLFPGQLPLLHAHATALMQTEQDDAAIRRFEEALRVMRADGLLKDGQHAVQAARFHAALARLYSRQGRSEQSDRHHERARALRPERQ